MKHLRDEYITHEFSDDVVGVDSVFEYQGVQFTAKYSFSAGEYYLEDGITCVDCDDDEFKVFMSELITHGEEYAIDNNLYDEYILLQDHVQDL